ncbi:Uncharacterized protein FWK35_00036942 [Aphis craccivora]|uniref:Uncharacterized protein n=1 Tax=Aphis craccivora TaxID=307492 RepID=A0A6G0XZA0_APHCR|nr:Uncharacterized protein FWK35_00036942 [Aphis craccivora]
MIITASLLFLFLYINTLARVHGYIYIYIYRHSHKSTSLLVTLVCVRALRGRLLGGSNCSLDRADRRVGFGGRYIARHKGFDRIHYIYIYTFFFVSLYPPSFSVCRSSAVEKKRAFFKIYIYYTRYIVRIIINIHVRITRSIRSSTTLARIYNIHKYNSRRDKNRSGGACFWYKGSGQCVYVCLCVFVRFSPCMHTYVMYTRL